jgi:hypothetical protein
VRVHTCHTASGVTSAQLGTSGELSHTHGRWCCGTGALQSRMSACAMDSCGSCAHTCSSITSMHSCQAGPRGSTAHTRHTTQCTHDTEHVCLCALRLLWWTRLGPRMRCAVHTAAGYAYALHLVPCCHGVDEPHGHVCLARTLRVSTMQWHDDVKLTVARGCPLPGLPAPGCAGAMHQLEHLRANSALRGHACSPGSNGRRGMHRGSCAGTPPSGATACPHYPLTPHAHPVCCHSAPREELVST